MFLACRVHVMLLGELFSGLIIWQRTTVWCSLPCGGSSLPLKVFHRCLQFLDLRPCGLSPHGLLCLLVASLFSPYLGADLLSFNSV